VKDYGSCPFTVMYKGTLLCMECPHILSGVVGTYCYSMCKTSVAGHNQTAENADTSLGANTK
jgi:hypothetical protein